MADAPLVQLECNHRIATITLNDPGRRNALGLPMFDALQERLRTLHSMDDCVAVIIAGNGPAFCAGFDLAAAVDNPAIVGNYIEQLSITNRMIRRLPQVTIASVQGAALAGGCALLGACDFIFAEPHAKLGYPVHRLGVSPAVTLPTLRTRMEGGVMRTLLMGGNVIDGVEAHRIGLVTHLAESHDSLNQEAMRLATSFTTKGHTALRTTKAWLNELDGSLNDDAFDATVAGSAHLAVEDEAVKLLQAFWQKRQ